MTRNGILLKVWLWMGLLIFCPIQAQILDYTTYSGIVVDAGTGDRLASVSLRLVGTQLATVTNDDGEFTIKVPDNRDIQKIEFTLLGYQTRTVPIVQLDPGDNEIALQPIVNQLSQVEIPAFKDPLALVKRVLDKKGDNNLNQPARMTAFYRETIRRRRRNVSLTEAVVDIYKQPYTSTRADAITLRKARKQTDYRRLDTVALKLQGGPFSTLYLDIPKYSKYIFSRELLPDYEFSLGNNTTAKDGRVILMVYFRQKESVKLPRYSGKLFIDAETLALTGAEYRLNLEVDAESASRMFVRKKPRDIEVTPLQASYKVDYLMEGGRWHLNYSSLELSFKVDKRGKLFNSIYTLSSEMAITDWEPLNEGGVPRPRERLKPTVVLSDEVSGFADPDFWGPYNVIEPEKPIEAAIRKIQRKLRRSQQ